MESAASATTPESGRHAGDCSDSSGESVSVCYRLSHRLLQRQPLGGVRSGVALHDRVGSRGRIVWGIVVVHRSNSDARRRRHARHARGAVD